MALDDKREQIPYVRVATSDGRVREYFAEGVTQADLAGKLRRRMDCLDCHNRPAHRFGSSPERAVDAAIGEGRINAKIPFIRREAVRALMVPYASHDVALPEIERTIRDAMNARLPARLRGSRSAAGNRRHTGDLSEQRFSVHEGRLGHVPESDRAYRVDGMFPLP